MVDRRKRQLAHDCILLAVANFLFLANGQFFYGVSDPYTYLAIDYGTRVISIAILLIIPTLRTTVFERDKAHGWDRVAGPIGLIIMAVVVDRLVWRYIGWPLNEAFPPSFTVDIKGGVPPLLYWFDATLGLVLVAVSEELVASVVMFNLLKRHIRRHSVIILISSVVFALWHFEGGLGNVVEAGVVHIILMWAYIRSQSLKTVVAAHFAIDFVVLAILR